MDGERFDSSQLIGLIKEELTVRFAGRQALISILNQILPFLAHPHFDGGIEQAARRHAVASLLSSDTLQKIEPWGEETVAVLVGYLWQNYPDELEAWISDSGRIKLDPARVEEVERAVREVFNQNQTLLP